MTLLAVPNVSEGRDFAAVDRLRASLGNGVEVLDQSSDLDHNRTVFTLAGRPPDLTGPLLSLARSAMAEIDMTRWSGVHPAVGALDVCPVVWLEEPDRGAADTVARSLAAAIGNLGVPVFLYGEMASAPERQERAYFRKGGIAGLVERMDRGILLPDFGPDLPHPLAGATLVTARPPLAAFNVELEVTHPGTAASVAAEVRESGGGPPGLRAIGVELSTGREQVSMNVHDPVGLPLAEVVDLVAEAAARRGGRAIEAELIGLIPEAALDGYADRVPIRDFDPDFHLIEARLTRSA